MDGVACYRVEALVAPVALGRHLNSASIVLSYLVKADRLHHLALRSD